MKFNARHKQALRFYASYDHHRGLHPPHGVGKSTMDDLREYGYVSLVDHFFGSSYRITEKGQQTVNQWIPDDEYERLAKWNAKVAGKGGQS